MTAPSTRAALLGCLIAVTALAPSHADEPRRLYWAGTAGDPLGAGEGRWDANESVVWNENGTPTGDLVKWSSGCAAVFRGSVGGSVEIADPLNVATIHFEPKAGPFVLRTSAAAVQVNGAGFVCDSPQTQMLEVRRAMATFRGHASAGSGDFGSRVRIVSDALVEFSENSTAGRATIDNAGELRFSGTSSLAGATLINTSMTAIETPTPPTSTAIENHGHLALGEAFADGRGLVISNGDGGALDFTHAGSGESLPLGALANGPDSVLLCGTRTVAVQRLVLAGKNELSFDLADERHGSLVISGLLLGGAKESTRISLTAAAPLKPGRTFPLLDWSAATWTHGVELTDFVLEPLPDGVKGRLQIRDRKLVLELAAPGKKGR